MGAKLSRLAENINRRRRRSLATVDLEQECETPNGDIETGHDPAIHGARLEDRNYNNETFKKRTVDPGDPQQTQAALKIQTQFRQHSAKEEVQHMREDDAAARIQAGFRGFLDRESVRKMKEGDDGAQTKQDEEDVDIDLNDPEVEKAAIKIQAGFKGFKARKEVHGESAEQQATEERQKESQKEEEEVDIDLNDPDVGKAAVKIQAGFRGLMARKEASRTKEEAPPPEKKKEEEEEVDIDLNDPDVGKAALKIQAGFRGLMARKEKSQTPKEAPPPEKKPEEEEVDIDLNDPDVGKAALKIQAGFRGLKARKEVSQKPKEVPPQPETTKKEEEEEVDIDLDDPDVGKAALKIQAGFRGLKARKLQQKAEKPEKAQNEADASNVKDELADIDLGDPDLSKAALKIQAGFRGLKSRKHIQDKKAAKEEQQEKEAPEPEPEPEEVDIDLNDPEVEKAAVKIQAGFKGLKARRDLQKQTEGGDQEQTTTDDKAQEGQAEEEVDIDLEDPATEKAALKIQAGFRGYQTRKDLKDSGEEEGKGTQEAEEAPAATTEATGEGEGQTTEGGDEEVDIDLNDPEVAKATIKIQAGFKGYKARKELQSKAEESAQGETQEGEGQAEQVEQAEAEQAPAEEAGEEKQEEEVDIDLEDPEVEKAAVKIQAGFKGFKARRQVKEKLQEKEGDADEGAGQTEEGAEQENQEEVQTEEEPDEM